MPVKIIAIAAMDEGRVIGIKNRLPWHIPEDAQRFMTLTKGHTVLMGRKTYESLPPKYKPLPHRRNVVATREPSKFSVPQDVEVCASPVRFVEDCLSGKIQLSTGILWIVGGEEIYRLTLPFWHELYLTVVHSRNDGDAFFPEFEGQFELCESDEREGYSYLLYRRKS